MNRQAERSAATRARLLDATIACLSERGWAGTSTTEIVRRAGVSRGAQVHHYPTKDELVLAAVEHLLMRRVEEFRSTFTELPTDARTPGAALVLLWQRCFGTTHAAWLELVVAARTDAVLASRVTELDKRFRSVAVDAFRSAFPVADRDPDLAEVGLRLALAVLDGLAVARIAGADPAELVTAIEAFAALSAPHLTSPEDP